MSLKQIWAPYAWREAVIEDEYRFCPLCGSSLEKKMVDQRQRPYCPACGFIHFKNPAPGVSVLVVGGRQPSGNGRVLLTKRDSDLGGTDWALPSGYIEYDEDFMTAAIREVKGETGLDVAIKSIINVESAFVSPRYHFLTVYMLAHVVGGELQAGDDATAVDWFPLSGPLPEMAFSPDVKIIQGYAQGTLARFPISLAANEEN
jgi:ADP-ribose pyrophosphatase YjhB (NUDIX family)